MKRLLPAVALGRDEIGSAIQLGMHVAYRRAPAYTVAHSELWVHIPREAAAWHPMNWLPAAQHCTRRVMMKKIAGREAVQLTVATTITD